MWPPSPPRRPAARRNGACRGCGRWPRAPPRSLGQQVVEGLAVGQPLAEGVGQLAQLGIGALLHRRLEGVDLGHHRLAATRLLPSPKLRTLDSTTGRIPPPDRWADHHPPEFSSQPRSHSSDRGPGRGPSRSSRGRARRRPRRAGRPPRRAGRGRPGRPRRTGTRRGRRTPAGAAPRTAGPDWEKPPTMAATSRSSRLAQEAIAVPTARPALATLPRATSSPAAAAAASATPSATTRAGDASRRRGRGARCWVPRRSPPGSRARRRRSSARRARRRRGRRGRRCRWRRLEAAVEDEAAADAGGDGDAEQVGRARPGALPVLAHGEPDRVVVDEHAVAGELLGQALAQGEAAPSRAC